MLLNEKEYLKALQEALEHIKKAKYQAAVSANLALLHRNWHLGKLIVDNSKWGNKFIDNLARDIKLEYPSATGYSIRNLKYMKKFCISFAEDDIDEYNFSSLTWYHHMALMDKIKEKHHYLWYVEQAIEYGWSRNLLIHQIEYNLFSRQIETKKLQNFEKRLPDVQSDLAIQTMKDPYIFDFIDYRADMIETEVEAELIKNITKLLLELGTGFAFVGNQYHLQVENEDFYIDLLFYNLKLRCYVAIDLKMGKFIPEQAGKMNFYLSALDDMVKTENDNPSIGLILCKDENKMIAEYTLKDMKKPIGVSEYRVFENLPDELKSTLPDVDDITSRVMEDFNCK